MKNYLLEFFFFILFFNCLLLFILKAIKAKNKIIMIAKAMNAKIGTTADLKKKDYIFEPKLDGYRALCYVNKKVSFISFIPFSLKEAILPTSKYFWRMGSPSDSTPISERLSIERWILRKYFLFGLKKFMNFFYLNSFQ